MQPKEVSVMLMVVMMLIIFSCRKEEEKLHLLVEKEVNDDWVFSKAGENDWLPATVPGTVHTDLMGNDKIEDPYYRLNEHEVQWVDKSDWEYKTTFKVEKSLLRMDRVELEFKGLDTYADVYVNDNLVLQADNMFREWKIDVKNLVTEGENELRIVFRSPITEGLKKYDDQGYVIPVSDNDLVEIGQVEGGKKVSIYTRKAGYHFGWDWGPRLVTSGIWRRVILRAWNDARIKDLQIVQHGVLDDKATFTAIFEIKSEGKKSVSLSVINDDITLAIKSLQLQPGIKHYEVDFKIEQPKLWWTNGLGEAHLYNITGVLNIDELSLSKETRIGIRTLELVREKDDGGTSFYFKLNGHPVFMKGANVIPNDMFLPRVDEDKYARLIETAKSSNMNMLRV